MGNLLEVIRSKKNSLEEVLEELDNNIDNISFNSCIIIPLSKDKMAIYNNFKKSIINVEGGVDFSMVHEIDIEEMYDNNQFLKDIKLKIYHNGEINYSKILEESSVWDYSFGDFISLNNLKSNGINMEVINLNQDINGLILSF